MDIGGAIGRTIVAILAIVAIALLVGHLLGQPVLISYVETGSMAPTMEPGDGFIAVPTAIAGPIERGDVITWDAQNLHGGGLVTHRVVGETEAGFITRGDANQFTDQESSEREPPVQEEQVVAKALQLGGEVVVLPGLGLIVLVTQDVMSGLQQQLAVVLGTRSVLGTQGLSYLLFGLGMGAYILSIIFGSEEETSRSRDRETGAIDTRLVIAAMAAIMVVLVTMSMTVTSGAQMYGVVSSERDAPGAGVILQGQSEQTSYLVPSNGLLPVQVFLRPSGNGIDVSPREVYIPSGEQRTATVTLTAPPETGYYRYYLIEHRYLAVLPRATIRTLYAIHPWMPIIAIDTMLAVGFVGFGFAMVGFRQTRTRSRRSSRSSFSGRLKQWLR